MEKTILGIIGAEQQEVDLLLELLKGTRTTQKGRYLFYSGELNGCPAVIVKCGIGKVNAAACAQMMADLFGVEFLINTGAAGSLDARINIGDLVLSTEVLQHDVDVCELGYEPGMIPDTGMLFSADEQLRSLTRSCCAEILPDISVFEGRILTGDSFISGADTKRRLVELFGGLCAEMEGGAVAQVAAMNGIPFLIIRAISDKADGSATMDYPQFSGMASKRSAKLVAEMAKRLCAMHA